MCSKKVALQLFDVLEYIAYAKAPVTRAARVETNKDNIYNLLNSKQREFVECVLRNYVNVAVNRSTLRSSKAHPWV